MKDVSSIKLSEQLNLAQDLMIRFYKEIAILIKEIETQLKKTPEEYTILQTTGYGVAVSGSTGIEYPEWWLNPYFGVAFAPSKYVGKDRRGTKTKPTSRLKIVFVKIILRHENISEPEIWLGVIKNIKLNRGCSKFEQALSSFFYYYIEYENAWKNNEGPFVIDVPDDKWLSFKGKLKRVKLLHLSDNKEVYKKVVKTILDLSQ